MFQVSFSQVSFRLIQDEKSFGAERKIIRLRLKNRSAENFLSLSAMKGN
jgi:hypothetical protein